MDPTITPIENGGVLMGENTFRDETFSAVAATTHPEGTILARLTATGKLVAFIKGGAGGSEVPKAVLTYPVTSTGIQDIPIRAAVSGKFRKDRLVILADGDDSNIDAVVLDQLRDYGLFPVDVVENNIPDNE